MNLTHPSLLYCLFASLLLISGCERPTTPQTTLHVDLEMHYLLISDGNTGSARVRLRQYMDEHGESSQPLFLMGLSYHHDKRYAKAVQWFEHSASNKKSSLPYPPTWHFLGWSQYYLGNANESRAAFKHYLLLNPREGDSLFGLGLLAMEEGELGEATTFFQQSIDAQEDRPDGRAKSMVRLADIHVQQGNRIEAIPLYKEALKLNADLYEAWYHLSTTLNREGKQEGSTSALDMFVTTRNRVRPDLKGTRFPE